jgi:hypothetical protein
VRERDGVEGGSMICTDGRAAARVLMRAVMKIKIFMLDG